MISEDRIKGSYGIGMGMLLGILRMWLWIKHFPLLITLPLFVLATVIFTYGCIFYSKSKGYAPLLGLLGVLSIPRSGRTAVAARQERHILQRFARPSGAIMAQKAAARQKR